MSTVNSRMHTRAGRDISEEEAPPHAWRHREAYPTASEMFGSLGLALCAILYMVSVILLFAEILGR